MSVTFAKPNEKRKRAPEACSFNKIVSFPTDKEVDKLITAVKRFTPKSSMAHILCKESIMVKTCLGDVPLGSPLSYQLKRLNNNLNVEDSPDLPLDISSFLPNASWEANLNLSLEEARALEKKTKDQGNEEWQKARSIRLTSSNFAAICRRKKTVTHEFLKSVHIGNDISHIKSVKYGKKK